MAKPVALDVVRRLEDVLRATQGPLKRRERMELLARNGSRPTRAQFEAAVTFLVRYRLVHDGGSAGIVWLGVPHLAVLERLAQASIV